MCKFFRFLCVAFLAIFGTWKMDIPIKSCSVGHQLLPVIRSLGGFGIPKPPTCISTPGLPIFSQDLDLNSSNVLPPCHSAKDHHRVGSKIKGEHCPTQTQQQFTNNHSSFQRLCNCEFSCKKKIKVYTLKRGKKKTG